MTFTVQNFPMALRQRSRPVLLVVVLLVGWWLRLSGLPVPSWHPDEALYAFWARLVASGRDPLLLSPWVDKPPLHIYLVALAFRWFGIEMWAARLPGLVASLLSLPLFYLIARRMVGTGTAIMATFLLACSPLTVAFGPTVFTDSLLLGWGLLACLCAVRGWFLPAGVSLSLAVATKQHGLFVIPLALGLAWACRDAGWLSLHWRAAPLLAVEALPTPFPLRRCVGGPALKAPFVAMLVGFLPVFALLTWWDSLRWHNRPSFWEQSWAAYGGLAVAPPETWPARVGGWLHLGQFLLPSALFVPLLLLGAVAMLRSRSEPSHSAWRARVVVTGFVGSYFLVHTLLTFAIWDRYTLLLAPWLSLVLAWGIVEVYRRMAGGLRRLGRLALALIVVFAVYGGWRTAEGRSPVTSNRAAFSGLSDTLVWIGEHVASPAILYHHELGWHLDYELFDSDGRLVPRWYADGLHLANDVTWHSERLLLLAPAWSASSDGVAMALAVKGRRLVLCHVAAMMRLYEIVAADDKPC